jgi:hypothetical protein
MAAVTDSKTSGEGVRALVLKTVGFLPEDAYGWLYVCRGLYQLKKFQLVTEALTHCLRNEKTKQEAQHLLAFSLLHTDQTKQVRIA